MAAPVCVVAGVGPGIGAAVARRFARGGFSVALLARRAGELDALATELGSARAYSVDLLDAPAIAATIALVATDLGAPSALVYNAAAWREAHPMDISPAAFTAELALCATGALASAQAVHPAMKAAGAGTILFTGGGLALHPEYGSKVLGLTAGKSALRGMTLALAPVLAADGVHVATVTVAGVVAAGGAFDPNRIAEAFWTLHAQPREAWTSEIVFTGA